jgi:hypothetical protein
MTDEQLNDALYQFGISTNGKSPLSMVQIKRKSREWKKKVYNDFHATNNIGSITNIHASDLQIRDVVNFTYLLTYLQLPMSRLVCRWETERNGKRKQYKIRNALGS